MRVTFCGVRGSTPAPGAGFVRYGGHTSCVALSTGIDPPSLVLDAGSGLRRVTGLLEGQPFRGAVLLSHLHWDHIQGLGFFEAADCGQVDLRMPAQGDARSVLRGMVGPPFFPLVPGELRGDWEFAGLEAGEHRIGPWTVLALDVPHGGGRTFGYRIDDGSGVVAYLPDHDPLAVGPGADGLGVFHSAALRLADGADLLIHDSMLVASEVSARAHLGHASAEYAVGLAQMAGAARVALFHHDPDRTDAELEDLVDRLSGLSAVTVTAAAEGSTFEI